MRSTGSTTQGPAAGYLVGVDIGGTRTKTGIVDLDGRVSDETMDDTAAAVFADILPLVEAHVRAHMAARGPGCLGIGIALPGIVEAAFGSRYLPARSAGSRRFLCGRRSRPSSGCPSAASTMARPPPSPSGASVPPGGSTTSSG